MGAPLRVLLVEDNEGDALLLVGLLEQAGHNVIWERVDTPGAMTIALEDKEWDVVIADHAMPNFGVPASLELFKDKKLDVPFIIISGAIGEDTAVAAMKAGAHDYLTKNDLTRLVPAIERELRDAEVRRERRSVEESREISHRFLEIANRHSRMPSLLEEFVVDISERTGCDAVGIRLFNEDAAGSHQVYRGFPKRFYELECPQASLADGDCICGLVLKGGSVPDLPVFTKRGAFFANSGGDLSLAGADEADRFSDNLCSQFGYHSVAVVPIRMSDRILGLIHVADPNENMVSRRCIEMLEDVSLILGTAVARLETLQALGESEDRYKTLVGNLLSGICVVQDEKIIFANRFLIDLSGYSNEEVIGKPFFDFLHHEDRDRARELLARRLTQEDTTERYIFRLIKRNGDIAWLETFGTPIEYRGRSAILSNFVDITERMRAEQTLRESEERYRTLVEEAKDIIFTLDPKTLKITSVNNFGEEILGYRREDIVGTLKISDLVHPDGLDQATASLRERITEDIRHPNFAFRLRRSDGSYVDAEINAGLVRDSQGNPETYIGIVRDVTQRNRAEVALKESEDRYRTLVEYSLTGVYVRRGERILFVNDKAIEITGYEHEELLEMSPFSLIHPDHRERAAEEMARREADEEPNVPIQYQIVTKSGKLRWIETLGTKISYQGEPAILTNVADITERKHAEEALLESEEKYRLHFENMRDVIYTTDRTFRVTGVSPSVETVLGYKPEEIVGRRIDELNLLPSEYYEQALRNTARLLAGERYPPSEYEFISKDGTRKFGEIISSPMIKDGEVVATVNVARDITERKRAEQTIRDSEARYRTLFENTPIQIVVVDSEGRVTAINQARRATGEQPPKIGDKMYIDYASLHHNDMRAELMDCIATGAQKEFPEQPYGRRTLSIRMSSIPGGAMIISEDISERKRAEDWLKQSHSLLSATLESTADGIMVVDMQGNMLSSNRRFVEMWRVPEHVMASQDDERVRSFFLEQLKNPRAALKEENEIFADPEKERADMLEFKDGRIFERFTRPQKIGGKNVGIVFSFRDVTERKRAERDLGRSLSLLNATLESTADGILVVGTDGSIQSYNKRFLDIWRLSEGMMESLESMEIRSICLGQLKDVEAEVRRVQQLYANPDQERVDLLEFSGGRIVERYSKPQKLRGKTVGLVLSFRDITERRRAERKLLENREQLRLLTSQLSLAEERERRRIANQLHDRVGQSLLASKIKLGTVRESGPPSNIEESLDEAFTLLEQTIQDVRSLTFELSPPILYMLGFEAAVEWLTEETEKQYGIECAFEDDELPKPLEEDIKVLLFQNVRELLANVCKHSRAHKAKISVSKMQSNIRVLVEDDGVGFDSSKVGSHWDESSGFGLFSIRERLSHLGGDFKIDSEPGRGTRISLTAPLKMDDEPTHGEKT